MTDFEAVRAFSARMFGSLYRLEVSCAIANEPTGIVWLTGVAEQTELPPARVHKTLQQLVELGLLEPLPVPRGQQARYYRRVESAYWPYVLQARESARQLGIEVPPEAPP